MAKPDERHILDALSAAGFKSPPIAFYKEDPRGPEYGQFKVSFSVGPGIDIAVEKWRQQEGQGKAGELKVDYTLHFTTAADFTAWAADCT